MKVVPFGEVIKDRIDLSQKFGLIRCVSGFWMLTAKCKRVYDFESYIDYLRGNIEKPLRIGERKQTKPEIIGALLEL